MTANMMRSFVQGSEDDKFIIDAEEVWPEQLLPPSKKPRGGQLFPITNHSLEDSQDNDDEKCSGNKGNEMVVQAQDDKHDYAISSNVTKEQDLAVPPSVDSASWQAAQNILRHSDAHAPNLHKFEGSVQKWQKVHDSLGLACESFQESMQECLTKVWQSISLPLYEATSEQVRQLEQHVGQLLQSNHDRRAHMLQILNLRYKTEQAYYAKTLARILSQEPPSDPTLSEPESTLHGIHQQESSLQSQETNSELDWSLLSAQYKPAEALIQRLRQAHETFEHADESMVEALQSTLTNLQELLEQILEWTHAMYIEMQENLWQQQTALQLAMMRNVERRTHYQRALEETAQQAQGFFARLLQQVQSLSNGMPAPHSERKH